MSSHKKTKQRKEFEKQQINDVDTNEQINIIEQRFNSENDAYKNIRLGGIMARANNWWEDNGQVDEDENNEEVNDEKEWKYLEHHGVIFPPLYKPHGIPLIYDGKPIPLNLEQEELATYWAQTIGTPWQEKSTYQNNFTQLMQSKFKNMEFSLDKCDFSRIRMYLDEQRMIKLNRSEEVKKQEKIDKEQRDKTYGHALVDGCLERVGNYTLEPPTLFKGRGEHPKAGLLKGRLYPEDLTVNISKQAPVPRCTLPGHSWGNILSRNDVTWLVSYVDSSIKKDNHKYVQFAATSRFKQMNDKKKYEKARKLKNCIDTIRDNYMELLNNENSKKRQLGTATYLIDRLALRVGNEKGDDEADTVGCCSLRVEHISVKDNETIVFDFLGKDSMRYYNEVKLDQQVCKNISTFLKNKQQGMDLFDKIKSDDLNEYLKDQMKGLTAKVFRTYNASFTLQQELDKGNKMLQQLDALDIQRKVDYYDAANKQVAVLCNHQKTIPRSFELMKQKINYRIQVYKDYLQELQKHLKHKNMQEYEEEVDLEPQLQEEQDKKVNQEQKKKSQVFIKKFPGTKERTQQLIENIEKKIVKEISALEKRDENKEIALGTSKTNYNDPRISVNWCKVNEVPIEKIFPKTLREKFIWAMATDPNWKF